MSKMPWDPEYWRNRWIKDLLILIIVLLFVLILGMTLFYCGDANVK